MTAPPSNLPPGCTSDDIDESAGEETYRTQGEEREEMEREKAERLMDEEMGK